MAHACALVALVCCSFLNNADAIQLPKAHFEEDADPWHLVQDPFVVNFQARGEIERPRLLAMRGCSGSSAIRVYARTLLKYHGIPVPAAALPNIVDGEPKAPHTRGLPAELLNPKINWMYKEAGNDIGKAMEMQNERTRSRGQTLFFKGMLQHMQGVNTGADEWESLAEPFKRMQLQAVIGTRDNMLDEVICQVKDCFQQDYGVPVTKDGEPSSLCFDRRAGEAGPPTAAEKEQRRKTEIEEGQAEEAQAGPPTAAEKEQFADKAPSLGEKEPTAADWDEVQTLQDKALKLYSFGKDRDVQGAIDDLVDNSSAGADEYLAKLDVDMVVKAIRKEFHKIDNAKAKLEEIGVNAKTVRQEDLLDFQTGDDASTFQRAVDAWSEFLSALGVMPNRALITSFLQQYANTYHEHSPHWKTIYNYQEIKAELEKAPAKYAFMVRE